MELRFETSVFPIGDEPGLERIPYACALDLHL